jgi:toxin ParE1/3/4
MKNSYRVSGRAAADLDEIWSYIAQDNAAAADKFISAFFLRFSRIATRPEIGRKREELSPGLRSFPSGRYIVFYHLTEGGIEIVRVFHGARDFPPLFE